MKRLCLVAAALLVLGGCAPKMSKTGSGNTYGGLLLTGAAGSQAPSNIISVTLGEKSTTQMTITLSGAVAVSGPVSFLVTNTGKEKHEFVVLKTNTPAGNLPVTSFEGEADRFNEDTAGTNVGETGDMPPGASKVLTIDMKPGHYAVVCNLPGHYRMGMHQDFNVVPQNAVTVSLGETDATHMAITLSAPTASAGKVSFLVTNAGKEKHEFVVLRTDTLAANFPVASFEGEADRVNEDTAGTNVGETGDMTPGQAKTLTIDLKPGHYAVVCNLPGHYRMGMHQDFNVIAPDTVTVGLGETDATHMAITMSATTAIAGKVSFAVTNTGKEKHEFVVLKTNTPAANFPVTSFEGEADRFNEDTSGTNVGETGDMAPGETKTLAIELKPGHYAVVCNLPGHYRMGMHQDFNVLSPNTVDVTLGETDMSHMFINLSDAFATAGSVRFVVTNNGKEKHEFVVLKTDTPAANFIIASFEGETDRFNEDTSGTNVGETGDMVPGQTKTLTIVLKAGHYAVVCNLPGHYRMGMHQDFIVS